METGHHKRCSVGDDKNEAEESIKAIAPEGIA